jgi:hypothetical protein
MTENVQSVVTAQANGLFPSEPIVTLEDVTTTAKAAKTTKARKTKAMASVVIPEVVEDTRTSAEVVAEAQAVAKFDAYWNAVDEATITVEQAVEVAYNYGANIAGIDGKLTKALQTYKANEAVQNDMLEALNVGYLTRKLSVSKIEATRVYNLKKYNPDPKHHNDEHRTFEQQRVMDTVRVLWHRAKKMAGLGKNEDQANAEATRAQKEAEKKAHEARLAKADEIVNPKDDVDVFDALNRLVLSMKAIQSKHASKLVGDRGMAWRDWLAAAPK